MYARTYVHAHTLGILHTQSQTCLDDVDVCGRGHDLRPCDGRELGLNELGLRLLATGLSADSAGHEAESGEDGEETHDERIV